MKKLNNKLIGVLLALFGLFLMPIFTIITVVPFFLERFGFPPLIPEFLKQLDWHLILLTSLSIPVYFVFLSISWIGYRKIKDPSIIIKEEFKAIYLKIPRFFKKLFNES